jgi:hypothetical protein
MKSKTNEKKNNKTMTPRGLNLKKKNEVNYQTKKINNLRDLEGKLIQ